MNNWGANHGAISYGHIGADLISLAAMLRIPVYMHNVRRNDRDFPSEHVGGVRHGGCLESADYRACKNFGPLYANPLIRLLCSGPILPRITRSKRRILTTPPD
jgi:L-fucose/D-arabinose isomerase